MGRRKKIKFVLPRVTISKRQKFVFLSLILSLGFLIIQLLGGESGEARFLGIGALSLAAFLFSAWVLKEEISGIKWLTLLILPTAFTATLGLAYFLFPVRWLTRLPTTFLYGVGMYAILLTENIYNVAAEKTIQLVRAAQAVGFLLTLITFFLFFITLFSFHLPFWENFLLVSGVAFPLIFQSLWSVKMEKGITRQILTMSLFLALILGEMALVFSFWPMKIIFLAFLLTATSYTLVGSTQQELLERLFKKTASEFLAVSVIVFLFILWTTHWGE